MRRLDVSRRRLCAALASLGVAALATPSAADVVLSVALPAPGSDDDAPSFDRFAALSCLITGFDDLDLAATDRLWAVFRDEPWGVQHVNRAYRGIHAALNDERAGPDAAAAATLDDGARWFVGHLLTTWVVGVYHYGDAPPRRLLWEHALARRTVDDVVPTWFEGERRPGAWVDDL